MLVAIADERLPADHLDSAPAREVVRAIPESAHDGGLGLAIPVLTAHEASRLASPLHLPELMIEPQVTAEQHRADPAGEGDDAEGRYTNGAHAHVYIRSSNSP